MRMTLGNDSVDAGIRLSEALQPLLEELGPGAAERFLPDLVREVSGADAASIAVLQPDGLGIDRVLDAENAAPEHATVAEAVIRSAIPGPEAIEGVVEGRAVLPDGEECDFLLARLVVGDREAGIACTLVGGIRGFSDVDREAFGLLLPWVGAVIATDAAGHPGMGPTILEDRLRRELAATERERKRWARNLHDETLQSLGVLHFGLAAALEAPEEGDRKAMTVAVAALAEQIENLRGLIDDLRPSVLDQLGLGPALVSLIERVRRVSGVRVDIRLALGEDITRLPDDVELMVYRLVQEALNNTVKHANARTVRLAVARRHGCLELLVADDGQGFDVDAATRGAGLAGMGERVALARGRLEIRSRIGTGTTVEVELPL